MIFLASYILKGRVQAMIVASSLALLSLLFPPVGIISSATIALVTLRLGSIEGVFLIICSCLSAALLGFLLFGNYFVALLYGLILWLPVWLIAIVLRKTKHLSAVVEFAVLLGVTGIIGFYIFVDNPTVLWDSVLSQILQPIIQSNNDVVADEIKIKAQAFVPYMTGGVITGLVYSLLFSIFLARIWQSVLYNPGGFRTEYLALKVHNKVALTSICIFLFAWFMPGVIAEICWNITIIFVALYSFTGTAILHNVCSRLRARRFLIPFLYIILVIIPHAIAVVVIIGVVDVWFNLRNRFFS